MVQVFDSSDTTWNMHLQGAKGVLDAFSPLDRSNPSLTFMIHWLQYHDVFSAYSHPVSPSSSRSGSNPSRMPTIVLPPSTESNKQVSKTAHSQPKQEITYVRLKPRSSAS